MRILYLIILFIIMAILDRVIYKIMMIISTNSTVNDLYFIIQDSEERKLFLKNKKGMKYLYTKSRIVSLLTTIFINIILGLTMIIMVYM